MSNFLPNVMLPSVTFSTQRYPCRRFALSSFSRRTHLALAAQPSEQLVALELGFLIGHNTRHLEDEPRWPRLFVQTHSVKRQHSHPRMLAHCVHHLRRRGSTGPPGRHSLLLHFFLFADVTEVDWDHDYRSLSLLSSREISRFSEEKKKRSSES